MGALSGLVAVGICLIWALKSPKRDTTTCSASYQCNICHRAGRIVDRQGSRLRRGHQFIRQLPTEHFKAWFEDWTGDKALEKRPTPSSPGYGWRCSCCVLPFRFRCTLTNNVAALGVARPYGHSVLGARHLGEAISSSPRRCTGIGSPRRMPDGRKNGDSTIDTVADSKGRINNAG